MNPLLQCQACGGRFTRYQADGSEYHHACPPLPPDKNGVQKLRPGHVDETIVITEPWDVQLDNGVRINPKLAPPGRRVSPILGKRSPGAGVREVSEL